MKNLEAFIWVGNLVASTRESRECLSRFFDLNSSEPKGMSSTMRIGYMVIGYKVKSAIRSNFSWSRTEWAFIQWIVLVIWPEKLVIWSIFAEIVASYIRLFFLYSAICCINKASEEESKQCNNKAPQENKASNENSGRFLTCSMSLFIILVL